MSSNQTAKARSAKVWLNANSCDLEAFIQQTSRTTRLEDYPYASAIAANVPVYECDAIRAAARDPDTRKEILAEWADGMLNGSGMVVLKKAFADTAIIDAASNIFNEMIAEQHRAGTAGGDHFGKPGANDRVWNAQEKLCLAAPDVFAAYYANEMIAMVSEAWLGIGYQITSQLNVVNPGGAAQSAHRDYHMGFQSVAEIERFPSHAHRLSPMLTLQGAVAHVDMPLESGTTLYLPYSQSYEPGYFAYHKPEFKAYFAAHHMQLPLQKGDAVFFNPALFHGAGNNVTKDIKRMANLLQVSSAYGRAMENMDRAAMAKALYPTLATSNAPQSEIANAVAACAEGYAFPTNLDRDPPLGGLAPQTPAALMLQALSEGWEAAKFNAALDKRMWSRLT